MLLDKSVSLFIGILIPLLHYITRRIVLSMGALECMIVVFVFDKMNTLRIKIALEIRRIITSSLAGRVRLSS